MIARLLLALLLLAVPPALQGQDAPQPRRGPPQQDRLDPYVAPEDAADLQRRDVETFGPMGYAFFVLLLLGVLLGLVYWFRRTAANLGLPETAEADEAPRDARGRTTAPDEEIRSE